MSLHILVFSESEGPFIWHMFYITSRRINETHNRHIINVWEQSHTKTLLRKGVDKCVDELMIHFNGELIILSRFIFRDS